MALNRIERSEISKHGIINASLPGKGTELGLEFSNPFCAKNGGRERARPRLFFSHGNDIEIYTKIDMRLIVIFPIFARVSVDEILVRFARILRVSAALLCIVELSLLSGSIPDPTGSSAHTQASPLHVEQTFISLGQTGLDRWLFRATATASNRQVARC